MATSAPGPASAFSMREILAEQVERLEASGSNLNIPQLIEESDLNVLSFDEKIAALQMQIAALVELRDRELATRAALQHLASPIRTLPVEILSEIFLLTLRSLPESESDFSHIPAAHRVSQVCSEWRFVALHTPQLWAGPLTFRLNKVSSAQNELYAAGLRVWLARSAARSIPIIFRFFWDDDDSWNSLNRRTLEEVVHVASRWRSLHFYGSGHRALSILRGLEPDSLLCLEELVLWTAEQDEARIDPTNIQCFSTAPKLRKLAINVSCRVPMPWAQLTALTLSDINTLDALADVFNQCPGLVHVHISLPGERLPAGRVNLIVLNHLRTLVLNFREAGALAMGFVAHLCAPVLDDLRLYFDILPEQNWDEQSFTTFQSRSPSITKLDLEIADSSLHISSHAFRNVFLHAPLLSHLQISMERFCDVALLEGLTHAESDAQPLLPRLCSLTFSDIQFGVVGDALADMIRSRWWTDEELASRPSPPAVARWSEVNLTGDYRNEREEISQSFRDSMDALRSSGLQVRVKDSET
ncbi:F-box domain-containing protein [Favolaschia claudopus]|uniref:F-box domain-containing protein n=1 Tax=Favolaschia claudopus TaxID=2862362 RepID=A0AAW0E8Y0_9AGAR